MKTPNTMNAAIILQALTTPDGRADPYPLYAQALSLGPVAAIDSGWYLVTGYDAVNQVLRNPGFGIPGTGEGLTERDAPTEQPALAALTQSILRANPPDHARMRTLISSVFTPRRVAALAPTIEASVDRLLDDVQDALSTGHPVDLMEHFAYQLPVSVICSVLGVPQSDRGRFRSLAADLTVALELVADPADLGPADAAAEELSRYFEQLVARVRTDARDDLLSALVAARDADPTRLSEVELIANLVVLLVAGFETTTNLLGNGVAILLEQPELIARLRCGDLPVDGFVEEVLRYDPPVQVAIRAAHTDGLRVADVAVPHGSRLVLLLGAANRDPARYTDPDRFDPTRSGSAPLSFGAGPHVCLGNSLARSEAAIALPRLLERFPQLRPAGEPTRRDRLVLRGYGSLPVTLAYAHTHREARDVPRPWEIGRPQPAVVALARAGELRGRLLDAGCGTGEHTVLAAGLGLDATGIDVDRTALARAEGKAAERGLEARFIQFDARELSRFDSGPFDTVLDCALFHSLTGDDRDRYVAGLQAVLRPGGRLLLLCYSTAQPDVPHRVGLDDLLAAFADGWQVDSIEPATLDTNLHPTGARGWLARITRSHTAAPRTTEDLRLDHQENGTTHDEHPR